MQSNSDTGPRGAGSATDRQYVIQPRTVLPIESWYTSVWLTLDNTEALPCLGLQQRGDRATRKRAPTILASLSVGTGRLDNHTARDRGGGTVHLRSSVARAPPRPLNGITLSPWKRRDLPHSSRTGQRLGRQRAEADLRRAG